MTEIPSGDLEKELRRATANEAVDAMHEIILADSGKIHYDTGLPNLGLPEGIYQKEKKRFEKDHRSVMSALQRYWLSSRSNPNDEPCVVSVKVDTAWPHDAVFNSDPFYTVVTAESIDGGVSRYGSTSWIDDGVLRLYDVFVDENGETTAIQGMEFPDDGFYARIHEQLSVRASLLLEYVSHGAVPEDGLESLLEHIQVELTRSFDNADEAKECVDELRRRSLQARGSFEMIKERAEDAVMSDMELMDLRDILRARLDK